jgi:hypothetical protein
MSNPIQGAIPRPTNPQEGFEHLQDSAIPWDQNDSIIVEINARDIPIIWRTKGHPFPRTLGDRDSFAVRIKYRPGSYCLERGAIISYLHSFENHTSQVETLPVTMVEHLRDALQNAPWINVFVTQDSRGGVTIQAYSEYYEPV